MLVPPEKVKKDTGMVRTESFQITDPLVSTTASDDSLTDIEESKYNI